MKKDLVDIKLHGHLGKKIKKSNWKLAVSSVGEAISAINNLTSEKLKKLLIRDHKKNIRYNVLINGNDFGHDRDLDINNPETIAESELCMRGDYIKTIDIIPVIQGANRLASIFTVILAIILIVIGVIIFPKNQALGTALVMAGLGLLAAGVANLLSKPPKPQQVETGPGSYMFNGPQNTSREGNPVPIGYGRLFVGSHIIAASYDVDYFSADPRDNALQTV
jgi:predicted phage tail protein